MTPHLYLDARVDEETLKKVVLHSVATALASMVLPVPGGPNISTPCICTSPCHMCRLDQPLSHVQTGPALVTFADWTRQFLLNSQATDFLQRGHCKYRDASNSLSNFWSQTDRDTHSLSLQKMDTSTHWLTYLACHTPKRI